MKILLALTNFNSLTGSEVYTYELARVLKSRNHEVSIMALKVGGEIYNKATALGIPVFQYFEADDINPPALEDLDIIHSAQPNPTTYCITHFDAPLVCTIHSQLIYERPIKHDKIKAYICIRPEIQEKIIGDGIDKSKTLVIYNGVDVSRFNHLEEIPIGAIQTQQRSLDEIKGSNGSQVLFVGTFDQLRIPTIQDLILRTEKDGKSLVIVANIDPKISDQFPKHVRIESPQWNIEIPTKNCTETASVYLGRTTIEGWMCGKPGYIYDVDNQGNILDVTYNEVPKDLTRFDIEYMADRVLDLYKEVLK